MLLGRDQNVIGHPPAQVRAAAERHLRAYGPGDIDLLMATVSPRGGVWAGLAPPQGAVLMRTPREIRRTYEGLLGAVGVGEPEKSVCLCTDWYVFMEGVTTVENRAAGVTVRSRSITLFANDELGTSADMAWPFGLNLAPATGAGEGAATDDERRRAHLRRMAGWAAADAQEAAFGVSETCSLFLPCFDPADPTLAVLLRSRDDYLGWLQALFAAQPPADLAPSTLLVRSDYVFSEHALTLGGVPIRYALAEILSAQGEVKGMLGYATLA